MYKGWREFLSSGNFLQRASLIELGVGLTVVYALQRLISDFLIGILMPLIGMLTGGFYFSDFFLALTSGVTAKTLDEARQQGAVLAYGEFLTTLIHFFIVMFVAVYVLRLLNRIVGRASEDGKVTPAPKDNR
jgi:large conductance mechanosensitive channel